MIKSIISRTYNSDETIGSVYVFNGEKLLYRCKSIELPDKGNQRKYSCIPEGVYKMVKYKRMNGDMAFHLQDVPGRDAILIHRGNFAAGKKIDTQGCILPGLFFTDINFDGYIDIGDSTPAMERLLEHIPDESLIHIL